MSAVDAGCSTQCISKSAKENKREKKREARIVVLGKDGVGKSALIVRYLTKRFIGDYDPSSEYSYTCNTHVDGKACTLLILDTAGKIDKNYPKEEHIKWGEGFLLVMSLTNRDSFDFVRKIKRSVDELRKEKTPVVLLANKSDLIHARKVTSQEVCNLASEWDCPCYEVAASESFYDIEIAFHSLFREIRNTQKRREKFWSLPPYHTHSTVLQKSKFLSALARLRDREKTQIHEEDTPADKDFRSRVYTL